MLGEPDACGWEPYRGGQFTGLQMSGQAKQKDNGKVTYPRFWCGDSWQRLSLEGRGVRIGGGASSGSQVNLKEIPCTEPHPGRAPSFERLIWPGHRIRHRWSVRGRIRDHRRDSGGGRYNPEGLLRGRRRRALVG